MNHNTAPAPNSAPVTTTATTTGSIVSEEFGDVNQYKELNAIGTGDVSADNARCSSQSVYLILASLLVTLFV